MRRWLILGALTVGWLSAIGTIAYTIVALNQGRKEGLYVGLGAAGRVRGKA